MPRRIAAEHSAVAHTATGKTGATATPVTVAGGTASGPPATGAHVKGEFVVDDLGQAWYCTVAGTPGTWVGLMAGSYVWKTGVYPTAGEAVFQAQVVGDTVPRTYLTADGLLWFGSGSAAMDAYIARSGPATLASAVAWQAPSLAATGKTGATATPITIAGGTASGAPTTGTHVKGEVVYDDRGKGWYCITAGTPGVWVPVATDMWREPCSLATTANIANLATGAPNTIDGATPDPFSGIGMRVLVKNQTTASQNGIYRIVSVGSGSNGQWVRADDMPVGHQITGAYVLVTGGDTNEGQLFAVYPINETVTIGTSDLFWSTAPIGSGGGGDTLVALAPKTANYTAVAWDYVPVDTTGGAVQITLPASQPDAVQVHVHHVAGTYPCTVVSPSPPFNVSGGPTTMGVSLGETAQCLYEQSQNRWYLNAAPSPNTRALEAAPVILYGHSATVDSYNTLGGKWANLVQRRLGLGPVLSRATGGFDNFQTLERMMGVAAPGFSWVPGTKSIVVLMAGGNEQIQGNGNAALIDHFKDTLRASLGWLSSGTFVHVEDMTRVGTWTQVTTYSGVPRGQYRYSLNAGDTATTSVTGTTVNVFYSTWDGVAVQGRHLEVRIDGNLVGTIDTETAATTAEWGDTLLGGGIGCATFRGLTNAAHTVECRASATLGGGAGSPAATGVIGVSAESTTPPLIVVFADARAGAYANETEYNAIFGAIQASISDFGSPSHVRLIEANNGIPSSGIVGADGVHGNDRWEQHMAAKLEAELLKVTQTPWFPEPGSVLPGMGEPVATFSYPGTVATGVGALILPVPKSFVMLGAWAYIGTAPTGAPLIVDVNKNGTSVYANNQANRPTIPVSTLVAQYPVVPTATNGGFTYPVLFDTGNYISIDIDQVGSSVAGSNLTVVVEGIYR